MLPCDLHGEVKRQDNEPELMFSFKDLLKHLEMRSFVRCVDDVRDVLSGSSLF